MLKTKKEKASKIKDSIAPKRPPSAFFIFMEDFPKSFNENFPDSKSIAAVASGYSELQSLLDEVKVLKESASFG